MVMKLLCRSYCIEGIGGLVESVVGRLLDGIEEMEMALSTGYA